MNRNSSDVSEAERISRAYGIPLHEAEALLREHGGDHTRLGQIAENAVRFLKAPS